MNFIQPKMVLPIAIAVFLLPIIIVEIPILQFTHGDFAYPIDDACIHLAIAKNLAFHQVWGVSPVEFTSAASSIVYPLLLAVIVKVFGAHLIIPFLVNFIVAIILLVVIKKWLVQQGLSPLAQLCVLLAVILLTPLPVVVICGMEHTLHFLFTFLFLTRFCAGLERHSLHWTVYLYGALMVATRYEGLPLIVFACLILLARRQIMYSLQLGIYSAVPIVIFGLYSVSHGNFFFPNSVLLKSGAPPLTFDGLYDFFTNGLFYKLFFSVVGYNTIATQRLLFLLPMAFLLFYRQMSIGHKHLVLLLTAAVFTHLALTGYASFPRYEAYLIGCGTAVLGMLAAKYGRGLFAGTPQTAWWLTVCLCLFLAFPLVLRSNDAFEKVYKGSLGTYEIQYLSGRFLHHYYHDETVLLEALGGASYYSDGKKLDVVGLGDVDVARSLRGNYYSVDFLDSLSRRDKVKLAVASEYSTPPQLLQRWKKIATWQIPMHLGGYYVSFYAVDESIAPGLKKNLVEYQKFLPADERVIYY
ncbi:MAG: hypothetical protein J0H74_22330 [Chitinophagaceae bacterium]|nr:hypothetical protein [Chitinophagaceae bacterium]